MAVRRLSELELFVHLQFDKDSSKSSSPTNLSASTETHCSHSQTGELPAGDTSIGKPARPSFDFEKAYKDLDVSS